MRIRSFVLTLVAVLSVATATVQAQQAGQPANAGAQPAAAQRRQVPVAVIDLGYILNNHPTMKQEIEQIKSQSESVAAEFEKKRQAILKMMEELRENFTEGTPDYMKKEQEIAAMDTQFRLDVVRKNKEFDEKRAQIFYTVHAQVTEALQFYCQNMGTFVVLKVSREKPDPKKPQTIETAMMQKCSIIRTRLTLISRSGFSTRWWLAVVVLPIACLNKQPVPALAHQSRSSAPLGKLASTRQHMTWYSQPHDRRL